MKKEKIHAHQSTVKQARSSRPAATDVLLWLRGKQVAHGSQRFVCNAATVRETSLLL